jgi:FAD/FMN-containing dehydrogenase
MRPDRLLEESAVETFKTQFHGELLRPADDGYEAARRVYNAMIDRYPAMIARCVDPADVIAAVNFACQHHLEVAVRGGGHNAAALAHVMTAWSSIYPA